MRIFIISLVIFFCITGICFAQEDRADNKGSSPEQTDTGIAEKEQAFEEKYRTAVLGSEVIDFLPDGIKNILYIKILEIEYEDNEGNRRIEAYRLWRILLIIIILIMGFFFNKFLVIIIKKYSNKLEKKRKQEKRSFIVATVLALRRPFRVIVWAGIIRIIGFILIRFHSPGAVWLSEILLNISVLVFIYDFVEVVEYFLMERVKKTETKLDDTLVPIIKRGLRIIVVGLGCIQLFQSLSGQDISTILAGLGIGGLAVALAAQDSIKNFFGFLMITLDQPFRVGERIDFEGHDGVIEEIGLRSTKMRRLDGNIVTIPNMQAADRPIHNISRRPSIRRIMNIGVTYDTPPKKVEKAINIINELLKDHEGMHPDWLPRVYFNDFKEASLNIFVIYWYHPPDFWAYMDHAQWLNMEILKRFNKAGIEFAFPTQTIYLAQNDALKNIFGPLEAGKIELDKKKEKKK